MITSERLKRLIIALQNDDDDVLGDQKEYILLSIEKARKMYKKWEVGNSLKRLHEQVKTFLVAELPNALKDEACDVLVDLIDKDCQKEHIMTERLRSINKNYLLYVFNNNYLSAYNRKICEIALGLSNYVPGMFKQNKLKNYQLSEDEEDDEND